MDYQDYQKDYQLATDFILDKLDKYKKKKITHNLLIRYDREFLYCLDRLSQRGFFSRLVANLVSKYQIKSLDELLGFLTGHFEEILLPYFRHYFIHCPESINFVENKENIVKIDKELNCNNLLIHLYLKTPTKSFYYMTFIYYLESLNDPTDLSKNTFVTKLRIFDKLNPDKNHIPNAIKLMLKEFMKDPNYQPEEIIKRTIDYFSYDEIMKNGIIN